MTVPSDAVLGLQIERTVSSELARIEDKVDARVTRDVRVENRIAIPAGSTVRGSVIEVDKGGRMKGKARLAIRFHTLVLADGTPALAEERSGGPCGSVTWRTECCQDRRRGGRRGNSRRHPRRRQGRRHRCGSWRRRRHGRGDEQRP